MNHINAKKKWYQKLLFFSDWSLFEKTLLLIIVWGITIFYVLALVKPETWSTLNFLKGKSPLYDKPEYRITLDTVTSFAGIVNISCLIYTSKKRIASFFFGIAAVSLLGVVAIIQGNVGTWVLSLCIELPMNIAGIFMWRRASTDKTSIAPRRLNWWLRLIIFAVIAGLVAGAFFVFKNENFRKIWYINPEEHKDWYYVLPDAGLLIIGTAAMTLTLFRFKEIWYLWLIVDSTFVLLNILQSNWALVFSWTGGLICSIYGLLTWKAAKAISLKK